MVPIDATRRDPGRATTAMPASVFMQMGEPPSDEHLWRTLDLCAGLWETLVKETRLQARLGRTVWRFGEAGGGWQLFLVRPGRPSLILTPHVHGFTVTLNTTREAVRQTLLHPTPADVQALLEPLERAGGTQVLHLPIRGWDSLQTVRRLAGLKGPMVQASGPAR